MKHCSAESCSSCPTRIVCRCLSVTEGVIVEAIVAHGAESIGDLKRMTGAGDGCTCCHSELRQLIERFSLAVVAA